MTAHQKATSIGKTDLHFGSLQYRHSSYHMHILSEAPVLSHLYELSLDHLHKNPWAGLQVYSEPRLHMHTHPFL